MVFDPFSTQRGKPESQAEPVQAQPVAETKPVTETAVDQAADSKPVEKPSPASPFSHLRVEPKDQLEPERTRKPLSATELLVWIRRDWGKPTISLRDIQAYGPRALRDRETLLKQLEILES